MEQPEVYSASLPEASMTEQTTTAPGLEHRLTQQEQRALLSAPVPETPKRTITDTQREHLRRARAAKREKREALELGAIHSASEISHISKQLQALHDQMDAMEWEVTETIPAGIAGLSSSFEHGLKRKREDPREPTPRSAPSPDSYGTEPVLAPPDEHRDAPISGNAPASDECDYTGSMGTVAILGISLAAIWAGTYLTNNGRERFQNWMRPDHLQ